MCFYPVGWAWIEYDFQMGEKPARWEKRAKTVCSMGNLLDEPVREEGKTAFQNGINFRRTRIEGLLMRMVKRKEVSVIIYDHRMQGYEIDNRMRLDATLKVDVTRSIIGFNEFMRGDGWNCRIDANSLLESLGNQKGWELKSAKYDWLKIERYGRLLFERRGWPTSIGDYTNSVSAWYGSQFENEQVEPAYSTVQEIISKLHKEYSNCMDSEI